MMKPIFRGHCSFEVDGISKDEQKAFEMLEKYFVSKAKKEGMARCWHKKYDNLKKAFSKYKESVDFIKKSK